MSFNDGQVTRFVPRPKTPGNASDWSGLFDARYEEMLADMFNRKWSDEERSQRPPGLEYLWSSLFAPVLGRRIKPAEIPAILSVSSKVSDPKLVSRCKTALASIVRDDSIDREHHRLYADAERVLDTLKANHLDIAPGPSLFELASRYRSAPTDIIPPPESEPNEP
jgi:hypothetical protein